MSAPLRAPNPAVWIGPIMLLGAVLRFDGLGRRGLVYWDEGKFALEGVRILSVLQALPGVTAAVVAGKAVGTAKPTHALLIALSYGVFGVHDYAALFLNAGASVVEIGVLFLLARRLFGVQVALISALFLAVAGYDIVYARSALSESDADLIFLLGTLVWWTGYLRAGMPRASSGWHRVFWAGLLLGLSFTTNYRLIVYIVTLVAVDLVWSWMRRGRRETMRHALVWPLGLAVMPLLWQFIGLLAAGHGITLFHAELTNRPSSYLDEVLYQLHGGKQAATNLSPLPYVQWYVQRQGWLLSILLLVGLGIACLRRSPALVISAVLVAVPYGVYVFAPFIVPRNLDAALPFATLLTATGMGAVIKALPRFWRRSRSVAGAHEYSPRIAGLTILVGVTTALRAWPLTEIQSGYAKAASYVAQHGADGALALNEVMRFYLRDGGRGCDAPRLPRTMSGLAAADQSGYDYAIVDQYNQPLARYLLMHARVLQRFPAVNESPFGENLIVSENGNQAGSPSAIVISVYALDSIHAASARARAFTTCSLDQLA